jgi:hypothetical protein
MAFRSLRLWQSGIASPSVWMPARASPNPRSAVVARLNPGTGHASGQATREVVMIQALLAVLIALSGSGWFGISGW